jgi:threonine dehydrogenase-like Zn-dependent dehydrogenase
MDLDDAVLLTEVVPTGYQAAEMAGITRGDTVVVFGAGPVGIMAARCAWLFGAGRVIVIDWVPLRLEFARDYGPADVYDFREIDDMAEFIQEADGLARGRRLHRRGWGGRLRQPPPHPFRQEAPPRGGLRDPPPLGDQLG